MTELRPPALISVIIPCYNVEQYVVRAIQSILNQTYTNLEIWLVDDASTDGTLQQLQSVIDPRVMVHTVAVNTQKIGAVNEVLQLVTGQYIAFQDADDWSNPKRLEAQLNLMQDHPEIGICFTDYSYAGISGDHPSSPAFTHTELVDEFHNFGKPNDQLFKPTCCATMMITREALEKTGGYHPYFKGRVAEDIHWVYRILKFFKGSCVKEKLYEILLRGDSLTGSQLSGTNAKAAYSWPLLQRIIQLDLQDNIDALADESLMQILELAACEEALSKQIQLTRATANNYKNSRSYRIGDALLKPFRFFRNVKSESREGNAY